ncbi:hypothetical protein HWV62_43313 [Athelia sp. TMB]|nr:hypothetical protein HWV62_43313 [Athelia sp. TMB]
MEQTPEERKSGLSSMFSRNIPVTRGRRVSVPGSSDSANGGAQQSPPEPVFALEASPSSGHYITVLDLAPLLSLPSRVALKPIPIAEFVASRRYPISGIHFTADGNGIIVSPADGRLLRVLNIRPSPPATKLAAAARLEAEVLGEAPRMYDMRRGQTAAVVDEVEGSADGRWIAVGSRKRTIHVFAVNPYGGKADQKSHLEGRVRNVDDIPLSTQVAPIVRLRALHAPPPDHFPIPLAFTFIQSSDAALPTNLLPPATYTHSAPTSVQSSPVMHAEPVSPHQLKRPTNYQDVLVFDAMDGSLSLRRFTLDQRSRDQLTLPSSVGGTSISLPGVSLSSRLGISPPSGGSKSSGLSQMMDTTRELVLSSSNTVASWSLKRGHDWTEVRQVLHPQPVISRKGLSVKSNSLAHAELSPAPKSHRLVPRSIYLSHQFFFQALGEDYHALIRRFHLDIGGSKIEVRREVAVQAFPTSTSENFVEEFSAPRDMHTNPSSFDEPLASALSGGLDYANPSRTIPMLPNGAPKAFKNPVPIRNMANGISDGMSESLGRIRREMHKVRSPVLGPRSDISGSVPLEFDEEDFLDRGENYLHVRDDSFSRSNSRGEGSAASISTPSTNAAPLEDEVEDSWGWNKEDKPLVDDVEQFDDVVGFLDEEQPQTVVYKERKKGRR